MSYTSLSIQKKEQGDAVRYSKKIVNQILLRLRQRQHYAQTMINYITMMLYSTFLTVMRYSTFLSMAGGNKDVTKMWIALFIFMLYEYGHKHLQIKSNNLFHCCTYSATTPTQHCQTCYGCAASVAMKMQTESLSAMQIRKNRC
jgi:hypothetical protein